MSDSVEIYIKDMTYYKFLTNFTLFTPQLRTIKEISSRFPFMTHLYLFLCLPAHYDNYWMIKKKVKARTGHVTDYLQILYFLYPKSHKLIEIFSKLFIWDLCAFPHIPVKNRSLLHHSVESYSLDRNLIGQTDRQTEGRIYAILIPPR